MQDASGLEYGHLDKPSLWDKRLDHRRFIDRIQLSADRIGRAELQTCKYSDLTAIECTLAFRQEHTKCLPNFSQAQNLEIGSQPTSSSRRTLRLSGLQLVCATSFSTSDSILCANMAPTKSSKGKRTTADAMASTNSRTQVDHKYQLTQASPV